MTSTRNTDNLVWLCYISVGRRKGLLIVEGAIVSYPIRIDSLTCWRKNIEEGVTTNVDEALVTIDVIDNDPI